MEWTAETLPNEAGTLKALVLEQVAVNARLEEEKQAQQTYIEALHEQIRLLHHQRYGQRSEKFNRHQRDLFNEAEAIEAHPEQADQEQSIIVPAHTRKKGGRRALPANLSRIEVVHDLAEHEKLCTEDGERLVLIGEELCEQLDIIPAQVQVIRHIRKKYACPCCAIGVKTASLPPQPLPKSIASPGTLAHIAVSKYQDALPLYRQQNIFQRIGVELSRATLAHWMVRMGILIQPLMNLLRDQLLDYDIIQMDETPVQVLKEPGKTASSKSYMWVQKGGPPDRAILLYEYDPSRSQQVPSRLLNGFHGYLQTDGYEGYGAVGSQSSLIQVGCWAHARRKFDEAIKAQGKTKQPTAGKAAKALAFIQKLYRIEALIKDNTPDARFQARQEQALPILAEMRAWLDQSLPQVPPKSTLGKALYYLDHQWDKLIRYGEDGRLNIDNNPVERAIRPFVTGRKNWLFSDTVKGAKASANLYSLIETAKANGLEPYHYLHHVFKELPAAQSLSDFEALLPYNLNIDQINLAHRPVGKV
jgi:transposase